MNRRGFFRAIVAAVAIPVTAPLLAALPAVPRRYLMLQPKFIGKTYVLESTTMYVPRESYMLEFFTYAQPGAAVGATPTLAQIRI